jgi:hypothetical protein
MLPLPSLRDIPTRVLLGWYQHARYNPHSRYYGVDRFNPNLVDYGPEYHKNGYTWDQIKAELDTREHVPAGKEAKAVRKRMDWRRKHR